MKLPQGVADIHRPFIFTYILYTCKYTLYLHRQGEINHNAGRVVVNRELILTCRGGIFKGVCLATSEVVTRQHLRMRPIRQFSVTCIPCIDSVLNVPSSCVFDLTNFGVNVWCHLMSGQRVHHSHSWEKETDAVKTQYNTSPAPVWGIMKLLSQKWAIRKKTELKIKVSQTQNELILTNLLH